MIIFYIDMNNFRIISLFVTLLFLLLIYYEISNPNENPKK
jgi:hypothetical protein